MQFVSPLCICLREFSIAAVLDIGFYCTCLNPPGSICTSVMYLFERFLYSCSIRYCFYCMCLNPPGAICTSVMYLFERILYSCSIRYWFLAPVAEGKRAIVMALCPPCVRPSFSLKNFSSETIDWILTKFHRNVP